ncbi:class I SAM-dependent methyltransferase [Streptomyces physcomitrii]|uniref:Class I SAM-dependent methyltransferase n=1 Tax=Streptomyces physcomitrii TaxID=2724184 RepID=A0ABX1H5E1_9ACTN|nr:class I SAM-dependent methyltransferase [Streptomyces physcomitrii]NKI43588.1 class I SAM-dependent methyltransferase [Streptomyces physcomitrii]
MNPTPRPPSPDTPHSPSPHTTHASGHGDHDYDYDYDHDHDHDPTADQSEILDLDAEVLADHLDALTAWLPVGAAPRRILDLGCGTGAGTLALLGRFPGAEVTAVDACDAHLDRLREKAAAAGADDRVRLVRADLDAPAWPGLGAPQLVWASASLHHLADPVRALRRVRELLAPGGLLAVVELAGFPRFLPADAPESAPGLEERLHAVLDHRHTAQLPHRGADWGPLLTGAGFTVEDRRTLRLAIGSPHTEAVGRYALGGLRRMRERAAAELAPGDLAALDQLLDTGGPESLLRRADLAVRTERTAWAARRD